MNGTDLRQGFALQWQVGRGCLEAASEAYEESRLPTSLLPDEDALIRRLSHNGLSRGAATLAVVLATRQHARPEKELLDIVLQYPGLENIAVAEGALRELRELGWVQTREIENASLTSQAPGLRRQIAERLEDTQVAEILATLRANLDPAAASVVGPMNDEHVYSTYLDLLRSAQTEICLPMLVTSTRLSSVDILRARAKAGVRVKILVGAPHIVAAIRGPTMRTTAEERIREWVRHFDGLPSAEVRVSHAKEDMWLASCMAIDRRIVRLDIYDPEVQRSLQGIMFEFVNPSGLNLNLVRLFGELFDQAWQRARPVTGAGRVIWRLGRTWKIWIGLIFACLATFPVPVRGWLELMVGMASALLATALIEFGATRRRRRRRVSR
jgi:predicted transcriptional regulator